MPPARMRWFLLAVVCCSVAGGTPVHPVELPDCVDLAPDTRPGCAAERLENGLPGTRELRALADTLSRSPEAAAQVALEAERWMAAAVPEATDRRAALLDIAARGAGLRGRKEDAADLWGRALALDPGTDRVARFDGKGGAAWVSEVGPGAGRVSRAAEALLAAKRHDGARAAAGRAMLLGADARDLWERIGGGTPPGVDPEPGTLRLPDWFMNAGEFRVRRFQGPPIVVGDLGARVVLLDFWASWCAPCLVELPRLQALWEREKESGLAAIAVNSDEPFEIADAAARRLGLTMPIGRYDAELGRIFDVKTLPTVVLLDAAGRIRERWDGYRPGIEDEIEARVAELLAEDGSPPAVDGGSVPVGSSKLHVKWSRPLRRPITGLAAGRFGRAGERVVAGDGRELVSFAADGEIVSRISAEAASGTLRAGDVTGDGSVDLIGFRPGGRRIGVVDLDAGAATAWNAPDPCLDAAPAPGGETFPAGLILVTTGGVLRTEASGTVVSRMDVAAISACPTGSGPEHRLAVLSAGSELGWVDAGGSVGDTERVAPFWRRLAGGSHGVLAGTGEVTGIVPGRFLEDGTQVAVATRSGVVSVLDETDGSILYRAIVGAPARVAAADLDRDGLDELAISWGSRVAVLGAARRESVGASSDSAKVEILQESSVTESKEDME